MLEIKIFSWQVGELVQAAGINILTFVRREVGRAD